MNPSINACCDKIVKGGEKSCTDHGFMWGSGWQASGAVALARKYCRVLHVAQGLHRRGDTMRVVAYMTFGLLALGAALPGAARATCQDFEWPLGNELAFFSTPGSPDVAPGKDVPTYSLGGIAQLVPVAGVKFPKPPEKVPEEGTLGGYVVVKHITVGGMYQVTLADAAWLDVVQNGDVLKPVRLTMQPDCPGLHKSVRYMVKPGPLVLQFSGAKVAKLNFVVLPSR